MRCFIFLSLKAMIYSSFGQNKAQYEQKLKLAQTTSCALQWKFLELKQLFFLSVHHSFSLNIICYLGITFDLQKSCKNSTNCSYNPFSQLPLMLSFIWISSVFLLPFFLCSRIQRRLPQCFVSLVPSNS